MTVNAARQEARQNTYYFLIQIAYTLSGRDYEKDFGFQGDIHDPQHGSFRRAVPAVFLRRPESEFHFPPGTVRRKPVHPTLLPNERNRIGIVAGHWGFDSGHVCGPELNSLREVDVNLRIATYLRDILTERGYQADLLREFDPALNDYVEIALIAVP